MPPRSIELTQSVWEALCDERGLIGQIHPYVGRASAVIVRREQSVVGHSACVFERTGSLWGSCVDSVFTAGGY